MLPEGSMFLAENATSACRLNALFLCYSQVMKTEIPVTINVANLVGAKVFLQELTENDADLVLALYSDDFTAQSTLLHTALTSLEEATEWLRKFLETQPYKIVGNESKQAIGIIGLMTDSSGALHFYVSVMPAQRRKGIATAAMRLLFMEVFSNPGIDEIGAWINLEFFDQLKTIYETWNFRPLLIPTLARMASETDGDPSMGFYVLEKERFSCVQTAENGLNDLKLPKPRQKTLMPDQN